MQPRGAFGAIGIPAFWHLWSLLPKKKSVLVSFKCLSEGSVCLRLWDAASCDHVSAGASQPDYSTRHKSHYYAMVLAVDPTTSKNLKLREKSENMSDITKT